MKREIVLDTETTGFDPLKGDRLAEIACVELINHLPTGKTLHKYVNPERSMPPEATAVHGLTDEKLRGQPKFHEIVDEFLEFIGDSPLIIHNAAFDMRFLAAELTRAGRAPLPASRAVDTLMMARERFPGAPASLDALCKRFNVDNSGRKLHGALIDCDLLAGVYLGLIGGRQIGFGLDAAATNGRAGGGPRGAEAPAPRRPGPAPRFITAAEAEAHAAFIKTLGPNAIWLGAPKS